MGLKVWLPLNGDLHNQGCSNIIATGTNASINNSGKIGSCYSFSGNGYIKLNTAVLSNTTPAFSYCCWFKLNTVSANACLFSNRSEGSYTGFTIFYTAGNHFYFDTGSRMDIAIPITLQTGTWYHAAFTYKNNNGTLEKKIYLNGSMIHSGNGTTPTKGNATTAFIGASQNTSTTVNTNYLNGYLNDVRIYDHCLSAAEVHEISQGLVLHYKLDMPANINNNLYTGSEKFTGTWGNGGSWTTSTETYQNFVVKQRSNTWSGLYQNIPCAQNDIFTISFYGKVDSGGAIQSIHRSNLGNVTTGLQLLDGNFATSGSQFWVRTSDNGTSWKRYWATVKITGSDVTYLQWRLENSVSGKNFYICGLKLERGSAPTPWSPAASEAGETNIIRDSSGYGYNGTPNGTLTLSTDTARYSSSLYMPKATTIVHNSPVFRGTDQEWTCSLWIKLDTVNQSNIQLNNFNNGNRIVHSANSTALLYLNSGANDYYNYSNTSVPAGTWTHIAFVFKNSNVTKLIYINGVNKTNTGGPNKTSTPSGIPASVTMGVNLAGYISDYRIYCTALSAADIKQLYEMGAKVDNKQSLHTFELNESNPGRELLAVPLTTAYNSNTIRTNYDANGEITLTGKVSVGSDYIKINPVGKKYYFDVDLTVAASNSFYIGFQRYDASKSSRSGDATMYMLTLRPSANEVHKHYHLVWDTAVAISNQTTNFGYFDSNTPVDTIRLRILNDWSNSNARKATIHSISFREVPSLQNTKINKKGQVITDELMEMNVYCRIQKNGVVETPQIIEI